MSMVINTNVDALDALRNLGVTSQAFSSSVQKLSSGLRINTAADDAAGLAISNKLRGAGHRPQPGPAKRPGRRVDGPDR